MGLSLTDLPRRRPESIFMTHRFLRVTLPLSLTTLPMPAEPSTSLRLFVIGDSISIQYGPHLEKLVAGTFHYERKRDTSGDPEATRDLNVPTGANGGDSDMVVAYLRHRRAHDPIAADVLVLNCGLHDIKTEPATGMIQVPLAHYQANLRAIIDEAHAMNLRLVWMRTTPVIDEIHNTRSTAFHRYARDVAAYNTAADAIMGEAGVAIIDLHAFSTPHLPAGFSDHVHFIEPLREQQAAFIATELRRILTPAL